MDWKYSPYVSACLRRQGLEFKPQYCKEKEKNPVIVKTQMYIEDILLSDISQAQKDNNCIISLICET
jgi:hypothetical protein